MSRRALATAIVLLAIALTSGWWAWLHRNPTPLATTADRNLDSVFWNVSLTATNRATGLESVTLQAPRIVRNESDGTSVLTQPLFLLPDKNRNDWTVRARSGRLNRNGTLLQLQQDVSADAPNDPDAIPTSLRTERLDIYPERHLAKSDERVTVQRPGMIATGVGFEADLTSQFVSFFSKVRSRYDPVTARQSSPADPPRDSPPRQRTYK